MKKLYCLLFFVFILNSCGVNEEIAGESKSKSTTYTQKVEIDEVLTQLKNRNPELALFIESNPVSNLKAKSGKTDYYFDLKNVYAVKNDKNEAAYTIPLYIISEDQFNYLHRLSLEITPTHVDVKLVIIEGKDDGTLKYTAHPFNMYQKKNITSKTTEIECYCVTSVSDCTCHTTHASSGCDHPDVVTSCNCSGGPTGGGSYGTGTKTTWSGGSGSATSYTPSGSGVIFGLQKHFKTDFTIGPLLKYTIEQNVTYGKMLLDFLNEETSTPVNKAFVVEMLISMENGQFTTTKQVRNSIENFKYSQKSPFNVDLSTILDKPTLTESKKFIEVYKALSNSPEFKNLFLAIFENNEKHNVKFEIAEHVYKDDDPTKEEVNGITIGVPGSNDIKIKLSKQIFIAGTLKSQITIENAKTILHECIHAFLFIKKNNPSVGMDFIKTLNEAYPSADQQHDFMVNKMIPTMQKVLSEIRDSVTTESGRSEVENLTMHPTITPLTSTSWDWDEYYKSISLKGLEDTNGFIKEYPYPSDKFDFWDRYVKAGKTWLDKK
ncbi:hypothetical protein [Flavobacterium hydrophilum]|nr:hypothetical protein [Flavobacterium hydrophilum]